MVHPLKQYQDRGRKKIVQCMEAIYIDVETSGSIDNGKAETVRDHMSKATGGKKGNVSKRCDVSKSSIRFN